MPDAMSSQPSTRELRSLGTENLYSTRELTDIVLHACLVSKDAVFNTGSLLSTGTGMAVLAVKDCEYELDRYERLIDEHLPAAITHVGESEARQLLCCLKFITDLERIGDLMQWIVLTAQRCHPRLTKREAAPLLKMQQVLEEMIATVHRPFLSRDVALAQSVIKADRQIDDVRHSMFRSQVLKTTESPSRAINLLLMAQSFERAGDHAKNLGEELVHLFEGHSLRHATNGTRKGARNLSEV